MKRVTIILSALSVIATACQKDPYADAIITPNPAYVGEDITFDVEFQVIGEEEGIGHVFLFSRK